MGTVASISVAEQAAGVLSQATTLAVKTMAARQLAADLWDAIRAFRKQAESQKEDTCRPLKAAWEGAKEPFDAFVAECRRHESALQTKMSAWDREQERLAREEQAKIQAKIDAQNAKKIATAEAKGHDVADVVLKVVPVVPSPPKSLPTQAGTVQSRSVKKVYTPKDLASLMRDFPQLFDLSLPRFNALAKTGILDGRADVAVTEEYVYSQRS